MENYKVLASQNHMRLDKVLVSFMNDKSRNYVAKLIDDGHCLVNGKIAKVI